MRVFDKRGIGWRWRWTDLALGAHTAGGVNPDILGDDGALLWQLQVFFERRRVADDC